MALCRWCSAHITFQIQDNGRWLPYDSNGQIHNCSLKPESAVKKYQCRYCGVSIHWDNAIKSFQGKFLPLNADGTRHWCKENPIAKEQEKKKELKRIALGLPARRPFAQDPSGAPPKSVQQSNPELKRLKKEYTNWKQSTKNTLISKASEQLQQSKTEWLQEEQRLQSLNSERIKELKMKVSFADTQRVEEYNMQLIRMLQDRKELDKVNRWLSTLRIKPLLDLDEIKNLQDFIKAFTYSESVILEAYRELCLDLAIRDNGQVCSACMNAAIEARNELLDNFVYRIQFIKNNNNLSKN